MATAAQKLILRDYARRVRAALRAHPENTEPGLAPEFHRLLDELLPTLPAAPKLVVLPEFRNAGVGRPDIALKRAGAPARAFVELKAIGKPTDGSRWRGAHDKRQFKRFSELAHWATSNFHELRYYERGESLAHALCADGSGRISNVPQEVWDFAVSGYRVLPRWLAAREGEIGPGFIPEMRDVAQRVAELIFLFGEADRILEPTLADSLTREALGVAGGDAPQDEDPD